MRTLLLLSLIALFVTGCASSDQQAQNNSTDPAPVSTIPWNKPQSWEAGGMLGGAMGH